MGQSLKGGGGCGRETGCRFNALTSSTTQLYHRTHYKAQGSISLLIRTPSLNELIVTVIQWRALEDQRVQGPTRPLVNAHNAVTRV